MSRRFALIAHLDRRPWLTLVGCLLAVAALVVLRVAGATAGVWPSQGAVEAPASHESLRWVSIGPMPLTDARAPGDPARFNSGRVSTIAVDPGDPMHWLLGTGNGGIWQSRNAGVTWVPRTDDAETLAIGAIAFAPSNPTIVYAATGEAAGTGFTRAGLGMLKSVDGGSTWSMMAASTFARASVRRVRVHPANADMLLAITSRGGVGREAWKGAQGAPPYGVWKSTDGGVSWARTLAGQATALEIDATNFNHQYVAIGDQLVGNPDTPGAATNGLYRSTDGGQTWSFVAGPWGLIVSPNMSTVGRIELAMAPSNSNILYASIQVPPNGGTSNTSLLGLYRTDNAWAAVPTWTQVSTSALGASDYCGPGKCGYSHAIAVDPDDPNTLVAGGADSGYWRCGSCATGPTWANMDSRRMVHSDLHAIAWAGRRLIVGTDGGVWSTTDFGASWQNHNRTLSTAMFYGAALHPTNPQAIVAGLRDFALAMLLPNVGWVFVPQPAGSEWGEAEVGISTSRPDTDWMSAWIWGRIHRTRDAGQSGVRVDGGIDPAGSAFVAPVRMCPANENVLLTGTNRMWRTNDFFNAPSPAWSANGPAHPHPHPNSIYAPGTILSIAFAPADATCGTYAWGNRGGQASITRDSGLTWTSLDPNGILPARPLNGLAFHPLQPGTLYAVFSSFSNATPGQPGHVFRTTNALAAVPSWTDVSPPIDTPFNVIALDPRNPQRVYAGSDTGLWYSSNGAASWTRMGLANGLTNAPVHDIQINPATDRTIVFTYGRGAFVLADLPDAPGTLGATVAGNSVTLQWSTPATVADGVRPLGTPTSYVIRAGSASGQSNLADFDTGGLATSLITQGPNGTYFVRVHARNGWGLGPPSNEVAFTIGCAQSPETPGHFSGSVSGLAVTLSWLPAAGAASYRLEAGSAPGLSNLASFDVGAATTLQASAPPGRYYTRVRGVNACGVGPASNEVPLDVGSTLPLPGAPTNMSFQVGGLTVTLTWSPPTSGGAPSGYVVEAGSGPGLSNLAVVPTPASPLVAPGVPSGVYFVRVRAQNASGSGPATAEVTIQVP